MIFGVSCLKCLHILNVLDFRFQLNVRISIKYNLKSLVKWLYFFFVKLQVLVISRIIVFAFNKTVKSINRSIYKVQTTGVIPVQAVLSLNV